MAQRSRRKGPVLSSWALPGRGIKFKFRNFIYHLVNFLISRTFRYAMALVIGIAGWKYVWPKVHRYGRESEVNAKQASVIPELPTSTDSVVVRPKSGLVDSASIECENLLEQFRVEDERQQMLIKTYGLPDSLAIAHDDHWLKWIELVGIIPNKCRKFGNDSRYIKAVEFERMYTHG